MALHRSSSTPAVGGSAIRLDAERAARHIDALYRCAFALTGDAYEAQDLVQDVFESLARRPRGLHNDQRERAYLLAMLRHRYYDAFRARRRRPQFVELDRPGEEQEACAGAGPEARAEQGDVMRAVAALRPHHREALVAVDLAGLSYAEAADFLGVPLGTVMSRLHRARAAVVDAVAVPV
jgi:RNA polymerase sigma-70 factor (ECF subfamily)